MLDMGEIWEMAFLSALEGTSSCAGISRTDQELALVAGEFQFKVVRNAALIADAACREIERRRKARDAFKVAALGDNVVEKQRSEDKRCFHGSELGADYCIYCQIDAAAEKAS